MQEFDQLAKKLLNLGDRHERTDHAYPPHRAPRRVAPRAHRRPVGRADGADRAQRRRHDRGRGGARTRHDRWPDRGNHRHGAEAVGEPAAGADRHYRLHARSAGAEGDHRRRRPRQVRARRRHRRHVALLGIESGPVGLHPRHRPERFRLQPRPRRRRLCRRGLLRAHRRRGRRPARPRSRRNPEGTAGDAVRPEHDRWRDQRRHTPTLATPSAARAT